MNKLTNLILEEIQLYFEGVADSAYERMFGIRTDNELNKTLSHIQKNEEKPIGRIHDSFIYKNPKYLKNFESSVRAIGDIKGNLYVSQKDGEFTHTQMGDAINIDVYPERDYLRLARIGKRGIFGFSDNSVRKDFAEPFINALRLKNPQFKYIEDSYDNLMKWEREKFSKKTP
jgi:hypothetical protein